MYLELKKTFTLFIFDAKLK